MAPRCILMPETGSEISEYSHDLLVHFSWVRQMKKQKLWYGYLDAGKKSSPVAIDRNMDTGENHTVFIYNHNKKEILKYVRDLVEPKLRELTTKEKELESPMKKGFTASLKTMKYALPKSFDAPAAKAPASPEPKADITADEPEMEFSELGDDDDWEDEED